MQGRVASLSLLRVEQSDEVLIRDLGEQRDEPGHLQWAGGLAVGVVGVEGRRCCILGQAPDARRTPLDGRDLLHLANGALGEQVEHRLPLAVLQARVGAVLK